MVISTVIQRTGAKLLIICHLFLTDISYVGKLAIFVVTCRHESEKNWMQCRFTTLLLQTSVKWLCDDVACEKHYTNQILLNWNHGNGVEYDFFIYNVHNTTVFFNQEHVAKYVIESCQTQAKTFACTVLHLNGLNVVYMKAKLEI